MEFGALVALIVGLGAPLITYVVNPAIQRRLERQQKNDPSQGWREAVEELKRQVTGQEATIKTQGEQIARLRAEVDELEDEIRTKNDLITRQDKIIDLQGYMLRAYSSRVAQLEGALTALKASIPPMDPAVSYWLSQPVPANPT